MSIYSQSCWMVKGIDYDCLGEKVKCRADMEYARVFSVQCSTGSLRVLALDAEDAVKGAKERMPHKFRNWLPTD